MSWGFIDKKGKIVIEPKFNSVGAFKNGLARVSVNTVYPQKFKNIEGYIDSQGNMAIPPIFDRANDFCNGFAVIQIKDAENHGKYGVIDKKGNYVIQPYYDRISVFDGIYEGLTEVNLDGKTIYMDKNGRIILDVEDRPIKPECNSRGDILLPFSKDNKKGYISVNGNIVLEPIFDEAEHFSASNYNLAKVSLNNRFGYIDKMGKFIVEPVYERLGDFKEGLAEVKIDGKWGFIDLMGKIVIKPQFDFVHGFSDGLAVFRKENKCGAINSVGEYVIFQVFDKLLPFSEGLAGFEFSSIRYDEGIKEFVCVNKLHNWVHDKDFRNVLQASEGYMTGNNKNESLNTTQSEKIPDGNSCSDHETLIPQASTYIPEASIPKSKTNSSIKRGCYVATAVYGSYNCPQVWTLRRFRDYTLSKTWYGQTFVKAYYAISPALVKWFGKTAWFKRLWRKPLDKLVARLNNKGVEDTPYIDK